MRSPKFLFSAAVFALLALYPLVAGQFGVDLVTKIMIYAIFALSLELLVGSTGLVCFGHAALFGIGAYAAVKLSPEADAAALWWLLPASVLASALYALFMGALSLRTKGVYFINRMPSDIRWQEVVTIALVIPQLKRKLAKKH